MTEFEKFWDKFEKRFEKNNTSKEHMKFCWYMALSSFESKVGKIPRGEFSSKFYEAMSEIKPDTPHNMLKSYYD